MKLLLLVLAKFLIVVESVRFSPNGIALLENVDSGAARNSAFWKSWFDEFVEKAEDGRGCSKNGFFPTPGRSCQAFFRCVWSNATSAFKKYDFTCAPGTFFDVNIERCRHANEAKTLQSSCDFSDTKGQDRGHWNPNATGDTSAGFETKHFCIYDLHMSYIYGSPDGVLKRIIGFNGQFPGPILRCTRNKWMIIRVTNSIAADEPTSIHWHGIEQNLSPFYDGPESITQCPIILGTSMIYRFQLYQSGSYWYHSHHSYQYVEGAWGWLIIKNTPTEVYQSSYDEELPITINDWSHPTAKNLSETYLTLGTFPVTDSSLINAQGTFNCSLIQPGQVCDPALQGPAVITVTKGKRYRIRLLNASGARTYNFTIDNHKMVAIETDGVDTFPSPPVDIVQSWPAQRYSLLVTMNQPLCEYWIRITAIAPPAPGLNGLAILKYDNCVESVAGTEEIEGIAVEAAVVPEEGALQGRPDFQDIPWGDIAAKGGIRPATPAELRAFFPEEPPSIDSRQNEIEAEQAAKANQTRTPTTNPVDPNTAIMLDQMDCPPYELGGVGSAPTNVDVELVLVVEDCPLPGSPARQCVNGQPFTPGNTTSLPVLFQVIRGLQVADSYRPIYLPSLQQVVRLIINNHHRFPHPWHLHGHTFWVLGDGDGLAGDFNATRDTPSLNFQGVRRDTSFTQGNSWAVFVFITDNPGTWFLHCHINWHLEAGLGVTIIEAANISQVVYSAPPLQSYLTCRAVGVHI